MNADFQRVKDIFLGALEKEPGAPRSDYLDQTCGQDVELRQHVEGLLAKHDAAGSFLQSPAPGLTTVDEPASEHLGTVVGPYKLLQQIGEGGMGTVYMAEQTRPVQRKVALKIIKPGMDSRQVIARFEAERQALALMDHPNIARVLDAGTTEAGRPYFVMELVKGVPITKYCDEHHLTPKERLDLFVPICQAVQHAHQKGIIHRDLKPSNVLIALYDGRPVPKVIDFGVAKAMGQKLTEETLFTQFGQVVGTLEYMSPEQAEPNQLDIDTRSDIYALGVLLYELLTGTTPIQRKRLKEAAMLEALRIIREEEPPKPSTRLSTAEELPSIAANRGLEPRKLSGLVRGELDWIVMKCLEKDRNRRYETANGLARDLERYLNDEAVQACPPSALYRLRKFARRHRGPVLAASIILVLLLAGIIGTTAGLLRALRAEQRTAEQRQRAQDNLQLALKGLDAIYLQVAEERLPRDPQRKKEDTEILNRALDFYQQFAKQNSGESPARLEVSRAYRRVGDIQRFVGDHTAAEQAYRLAIVPAQELLSEFPGQPDYPYELAVAHNALGEELLDTGQMPAAEEQFQQAIQLLTPLTAQYPTMPHYRAELARSHHGLGKLHKQKGQRSAADESFGRALEIQKKVSTDFPSVPKYRADLAETHQSLGWWMEAGNTYGTREEVEHMRRASELLTKLAADYPGLPSYRYKLAGTLQRLACFAGPVTQRIEYFNQAIVHFTKLIDEFPQVPEYRRELAMCYGNSSAVYRWMGDWDTAGKCCRQHLDLRVKLAADYPSVTAYKAGLADALSMWGSVLIYRGELPQARQALEESLSYTRALFTASPNNTRYAALIVVRAYQLSGTLAELGHGAEALKLRQQAEQLFCATWKQVRKIRGPSSAARFCADVGGDLEDEGKIWKQRGNRKGMAAAYGAAITALGQAIELDPQCEAWLRAATPGDEIPWLIRAKLYEQLGQHEKAIGDFSKAIELEPKNAWQLNNLAWLFATCPEPKFLDAAKAVALAKKAAEMAPKEGTIWSTLGAAHYRAGNWKAAVETLNQSMALRNGGNSSDWFFLAMAHWQLGQKEEARQWFDKAVKGMGKDRPKGEELSRFRMEATQLLQVKK
jgi:serine/threonine protein kinase/Tfp pilus assembly protein PilF